MWGTAGQDCPQERDTDASSHMRCRADAASPGKGNKEEEEKFKGKFVRHADQFTNIHIGIERRPKCPSLPPWVVSVCPAT